MKGVIRASVSPGSSQRETRVTWTPMVRVPSGAAVAGEALASNAARTAATSEERTRISKPPVGTVSGTTLSSQWRRGYHISRYRTWAFGRDAVLINARWRNENMKRTRHLALAALLVLFAGLVSGAAAQAKPEGEMRWAMYVTLSPVWFDPGESVIGVLTPFWILYAMHDALVKPMPGNHLTPSLAESWTVSSDQKTYEFKLREGLKFHNGDPFTSEDVKFSFLRTKGAGAKALQKKVRDIVAADPYRVRFLLHEPYPDFMTYYGTLATGAGWIVPKKYFTSVGRDGFKKQPVGLGPYKFVSNTPGVELVMEAYEGYWRKMPSVKRLVFKSVPEATTRMAMLKRGEVDLAYLLDAPQAQDLKRDPNFKLAFSGGIGTFYLDYLDQWDPKSPWHDRRVRLAANYAIDRRSLNEAENLGASRLNGSIIPKSLEFARSEEHTA